MTLPNMNNIFSSNGTNGQVLSTNGSGTLSWIDNATGSITAVNGTTDQIDASTVGGVVTLSLPITTDLTNVNATGTVTFGTTGTSYVMPSTIGASGFSLSVPASGNVLEWKDTSTGITTINGTANQIDANTVTGTTTLSLPSTVNMTNANVSSNFSIGTGGTSYTFPSTMGTANYVLAAPSSGSSLQWIDVGSGSINAVNGTTNQIYANTVAGVATIGLPLTGITYGQDILIDDTVHDTVLLDASTGTIVVENASPNINIPYSTIASTGYTVQDNVYITSILKKIVFQQEQQAVIWLQLLTPTNLGITDGSHVFGVNNAGAMTLNGSVGNSLDVIISQGTNVLPAIGYTLTQTATFSLPLKFSGTGSTVYTSLLILNRFGNTVCAKMELTSSTLQNTVGSSSNKIIGDVTVDAQYLPTYAQNVGKISIVYLTGSSSSNFSIWGTGTVTVLTSGGNFRVYIATDPTGAETGASYVANNSYINLGSNWIGTADFTSQYYTFTYQVN